MENARLRMADCISGGFVCVCVWGGFSSRDLSLNPGLGRPPFHFSLSTLQLPRPPTRRGAHCCLRKPPPSTNGHAIKAARTRGVSWRAVGARGGAPHAPSVAPPGATPPSAVAGWPQQLRARPAPRAQSAPGSRGRPTSSPPPAAPASRAGFRATSPSLYPTSPPQKPPPAPHCFPHPLSPSSPPRPCSSAPSARRTTRAPWRRPAQRCDCWSSRRRWRAPPQALGLPRPRRRRRPQ